jgi:putative multiple sugar transport system permease protein
VITALIVLDTFVTTSTIIGRQIYAVGDNAQAAKLSGTKAERLALVTFREHGVVAALAGLVFASRLDTATPKNCGYWA